MKKPVSVGGGNRVLRREPGLLLCLSDIRVEVVCDHGVCRNRVSSERVIPSKEPLF